MYHRDDSKMNMALNHLGLLLLSVYLLLLIEFTLLKTVSA